MMRFSWLILCEGFGTGAQGALTAIGLNQNVLVAHSGMPTTTKRAVIGHLVDDDGLKDGDEVGFVLKVSAPNSHVVQEQQGLLRIGGGVLWEGLASTIDIPLELVLRVETLGDYRISMVVTSPDGSEMEESVDLHVVAPEERLAADSLIKADARQ